jgi:hypothetical protein
MLLIKIVGEDHTERSEQTPRPQRMRVLGMEIMRGCVPLLPLSFGPVLKLTLSHSLCSDADAQFLGLICRESLWPERIYRARHHVEAPSDGSPRCRVETDLWLGVKPASNPGRCRRHSRDSGDGRARDSLGRQDAGFHRRSHFPGFGHEATMVCTCLLGGVSC